jgi:hypothetical protein
MARRLDPLRPVERSRRHGAHTGTPGVTGSPRGEAKVQVATEGTRVFLSGFLENGGFVVVTIFDELDNVGRHIAVMSRHESVFSYASQFLGTCE